jgi:hypothetical protein
MTPPTQRRSAQSGIKGHLLDAATGPFLMLGLMRQAVLPSGLFQIQRAAQHIRCTQPGIITLCSRDEAAERSFVEAGVLRHCDAAEAQNPTHRVCGVGEILPGPEGPSRSRFNFETALVWRPQFALEPTCRYFVFDWIGFVTVHTPQCALPFATGR